MSRVREFVDFTDGVQATELSGYLVDTYREQLQNLVRIPSIDKERSLYKNLGLSHLLGEAISQGVDVLLISQTGALGLRGSEGTDWSAVFQLTKALDNGNYVLPVPIRDIDNSELVFSQAPSPLEVDRIVTEFEVPDTLDGIE